MGQSLTDIAQVLKDTNIKMFSWSMPLSVPEIHDCRGN